MKAFKDTIAAPVSGMSLALFRIVFGLMIVLGATLNLFIPDDFQIENYITPDFHLKYTYFEWVPVWPSLALLKLHTVLVAIAGVFITLGLFYRVAIVVFTFLFGWAFLVEMAFYLNHYYLIILFACLMIFLPMHRVWSLDARRKGWDGTVANGALLTFKAQIEIVMLYAGLVKITPDWLQLEPLGTFLRARSTGVFGALVYEDWFVAMGAYGVIALHVIGAPLLFFKRTRFPVFIVYCGFHLLNSHMFAIDFFPYLTIAATTLFFEPDWPARVFKRLRRPQVAATPQPINQPLKWAACFWLVLQVLIPLRCLAYPGNSSWTGEGYGFAWRMMLDSHTAYASACRVEDTATGQIWRIKPEDYLTWRQLRTVSTRPQGVLQFAHYLEDKWKREHGVADVSVKCMFPVSLNGREPQPLVDPKADLTLENWGIAPEQYWIAPLTSPIVYWKDRTW